MDIPNKEMYVNMTDKEMVKRIITNPYDDNAAVFLIYEKYNPLIHKIYSGLFDTNSWYKDCQNELYCLLKGDEPYWQKLRSFEWKSQLSTWIRSVTYNKFKFRK